MIYIYKIDTKYIRYTNEFCCLTAPVLFLPLAAPKTSPLSAHPQRHKIFVKFKEPIKQLANES